MKYRVIILIVSQETQDIEKKIPLDYLQIYKKMKEISTIYFDLFKDHIKYFYIEYKEQDENIIETYNHLYVKGVEKYIPGVYNKTVNAIKYINENYDYDFILRTNVSSFIDVNNLLNLLYILPKNNFYGGTDIFPSFISGCCVILSRDVGNLLEIDNDTLFMNEDDLMGHKLIKNNIQMCKLPLISVHIIDNLYDSNKICHNDSILYYRVKNIDDREIDVLYHKCLLQKIYNIIT